jgi:hypothetical protein
MKNTKEAGQKVAGKPWEVLILKKRKKNEKNDKQLFVINPPRKGQLGVLVRIQSLIQASFVDMKRDIMMQTKDVVLLVVAARMTPVT